MASTSTAGEEAFLYSSSLHFFISLFLLFALFVKALFSHSPEIFSVFPAYLSIDTEACRYTHICVCFVCLFLFCFLFALRSFLLSFLFDSRDELKKKKKKKKDLRRRSSACCMRRNQKERSSEKEVTEVQKSPRVLAYRESKEKRE